MLHIDYARKTALHAIACCMLATLAACGGNDTNEGTSQDVGVPSATDDRYVISPAQGLQVSSANGVLANDRVGQNGTTLRVEAINITPGICSNANVLATDGSINCLAVTGAPVRTGALRYAAVDVANARNRAEATVTLVVNRAPTPTGDSLTVPFESNSNGQSTSPCTMIDVVANDTDPDGDGLTVISALVDAPGGTSPGSAQILSPTTICYRPALDSAATVRYSVVDQYSLPAEAAQSAVLVTIGSRADQDGQVIGNGDSFPINAGQVTDIAANRIFANDTVFGDPASNYSNADQSKSKIRAELVPGTGPRNHRSSGGAGRAPFKLEANGKFRYDHDNTKDTSGIPDSFDYRLIFTDTTTNPPTERRSSPTTVLLPLVDSNPPFAGVENPVRLNPNETRAECGQFACVDIPILYNDFDIDDGVVVFDSITISPQFGTVDVSQLNSSNNAGLLGTVRYTLTGNVGSQAQDSFRYRIKDSNGNLAQAIVTIAFSTGKTNAPPDSVVDDYFLPNTMQINVFPGRQRVNTQSPTSTILDESGGTATQAGVSDVDTKVLGFNALDSDSDILIVSRVGNCTLSSLAAKACTINPALRGTLVLRDAKRGWFTYTPPSTPDLPNPFIESTTYEVADGRGGFTVGTLQFTTPGLENIAPTTCADAAGGSSPCVDFHPETARLNLFEAAACGREVIFNVLLNDLDRNVEDRPQTTSGTGNNATTTFFTMLPAVSVSGEVAPAIEVLDQYDRTNFYVGASRKGGRGLAAPTNTNNTQNSQSGLGRIRAITQSYVDPSNGQTKVIPVAIAYQHVGPGGTCIAANAPDFDTFSYTAADFGSRRGERDLNSQPITVRVKLNKGVVQVTNGNPVFVDADNDGVKDCVDGYEAASTDPDGAGAMPSIPAYVTDGDRLYCNKLVTPNDTRRTEPVLAHDQCSASSGALVFANGCAQNTP